MHNFMVRLLRHSGGSVDHHCKCETKHSLRKLVTGMKLKARVCMQTYGDITFVPGPRLNLILGPNGALHTQTF